MGSDNSLYTAYAFLGAQAVFPILVGSFASVKTPSAITKRKNKSPSFPSTLDPDADDEDDDELEERIGLSDSLLFPVIASITLFSLFLVFKYLDPEWINKIIGGYFALASIFASQSTFSYLLNGIRDRILSRPSKKYHLRIEQGFKELIHIPFNKISLSLLPLSTLLPIIYIYLDRPWYLTNILSFSFAVSALSVLKLDGFKTGGALLTGLFFYDIFWVFGTPVMVSVAKNLDAPIKVLAPRDFSDESAGYSMLGLGDIVIPGIFISLALRYDFASYVTRTLKRNPDALPTKADSYSKPYFWTVLVAYVAGLTVTVVVMHVFKAAQPALLYLSPACIGSVALLGLIRGELNQLWKWSDEDTSSTPAKALTFEEASTLPDAPIDEKLVPKKNEASTTPPVTEEDKAEEEEDDDWMNLDNQQGKGEQGGKKKKGGSKKKK